MSTLKDPELEKIIQSFVAEFSDDEKLHSDYASIRDYSIKTVTDVIDRLCYKAQLFNQTRLPKGTELEKLAQSGVDWAKEDLSRAIYFKIIPEARLELEESFKAVAEILFVINEFSPVLLGKVVEAMWNSIPKRNWAMALLLYYVAEKLGDLVDPSINRGRHLAGSNQGTRTKTQIVLATLFTFILIRGGNQEALQHMSNLAKSNLTQVNVMERDNVDQAYAEFVLANHA